MSNRNNFSTYRNRNHTDPTASRYNSKYHQRNGPKNYRPESNRRPAGGDDVDSLMTSMDHHLPSNGNSFQDFSSRGRTDKYNGNRRPTRSTPQMRKVQQNQTGWWRVTINEAGNIGKERVITALRAHCPRQFQPYHYYIDPKNKAGIFFVNSQQDADMIKRANGKVEVQSLDILRIVICRVPTPIPSLDEDIRPHFKDYLINRRFDQQIFKLDLTNLADDEELSSLGIFPQCNKNAFMREVVDILNKDLHMTRQLDLGSNNIVNLYEFRNLQLNNLETLSLASNQLKSIDELGHLKQLTRINHIFLKDNPLMSSNNRRNGSSDDLISAIRQKLPQLKRIDGVELPAQIGFAIDIEAVNLPKSTPHCVPPDMQSFLAKFIEEYYRLFDTRGRGELYACYHDSCMFSLCVAPTEGSIVPTKSFKYGPLIYDSRNFKKLFDDNKRAVLLRHGKTDVLDFLRVKFPLTKHDGKSFHVDVLSTANNRAIFTVNGLYRELDQGTNGPVRSFQRTFTCLQTSSGVLIIADHIMIINATDAQITNMNRSAPPPPPTVASATTGTQSGTEPSIDTQNQLIQRFSHQSGMNIQFSKMCLAENNWNYDQAAQKFQECQKLNAIPPEAFIKP